MINNNSQLAQAFWERGKLDDCPIYDFHAHMAPASDIYFPTSTPEAMINTMKRCGTKLTVFVSHIALDYLEGAEIDLQMAKKYPEYFKLYHAVIPHKTDFKTAIERIEANPSMYLGFKFHSDMHKTAITDSAYEPFLAYMNENKLHSLFHTWGGSGYDGEDLMAKMADKYPDGTFICGHSFSGHWKRGVEVTKQFPNVYYELTAVMDDNGAIEILCEDAGSERVLFGTDLPWFDTHHGVGAVLAADISDDDRRNIFYRNGEKLLAKRFG